MDLNGSRRGPQSAWPSRVKIGLRSDCNSVLGERFTWGLNPTIDASVSKGEGSGSFLLLYRIEHKVFLKKPLTLY